MSPGQKQAVMAHWTPDIWCWKPHRRRWSPADGGPRQPVLFEVSTDNISPHEAYDFWCETALYYFDPDASSGNNTPGFTARGRGIIGKDVQFYVYTSDAISGARTRSQQRMDGGDNIDIGLVLTGNRHRRSDDDTVVDTQAGTFFCHDAARPVRVAWTAHNGAHLSLRRTAVEAALSCAMPPAGIIKQALMTCHLAPVLKDQIALFARHAGRLTPEEQAFMLDQTERLVLLALGQYASSRDIHIEKPAHSGLFIAAQRYIERYFATHDLQAGHIAQALGCSRATLYRAFAEHECGVADTIRELRLTHARRLLAKAPPHTRISDIAERCGFGEMRTFNRAFRARFGNCPKEMREQRADQFRKTSK